MRFICAFFWINLSPIANAKRDGNALADPGAGAAWAELRDAWPEFNLPRGTTPLYDALALLIEHAAKAERAGPRVGRPSSAR